MRSDAWRTNYGQRLSNFRDDLSLKGTPGGVHPGLYIEGAYTSLFSELCQLDEPPSNPSHPLNFIAYRPAKRNNQEWDKMIQNLVATTNWKSLFGLDYEQTIRLPFHELLSMIELQQELAEKANRRREQENKQMEKELEK